METASTPAPGTFTETWLPAADGTSFYTRTYSARPGPARAVVVFVHGFSGHCARYEWMHSEYAARGLTVFTFDQRGFGRTALDAEERAGTPGALYGKTGWHLQLGDIEWWVRYVKDQHPGLPVFLMGHSMGGALALAFATRANSPPAPETVELLSGVVASSPFLLRATPTPRHMRLIGWLLSFVLPNLVLHTHINPANLSHDLAKNEANSKDPRIIHKGSLRCLNDMLSGGEQLLWNDFKRWPRGLPVIGVHGTADKVTSFPASEEYFKKLQADDQVFVPFQDGYHELAYEPDGVKEKFVEECVSWMLKHATAPQAAH